MLTLFKKFFSKPEAVSEKPSAPPLMPVHIEPTVPVPNVEVVHLTLAALLERLPDDLKATVTQPPPASAQVTLPLATILKQLPSGSVKMSFASLHRQAPQGVFGAVPSAEKRLVEVPLAEIFRRVKPEVLQRRPDQRVADLPDESFNLFGNAANPYEMAARPPAPEPAALDPSPEPEPGLKMEPSPVPASAASSSFRLARDPAPVPPLILAPPPELRAPPVKPPLAISRTFAPKPEGSTLELPLEPLAAAWPEEIRHELSAGAQLALPTAEVTAGLARGKVAFTWGQLRSWLTPPPVDPSAADEATVLLLPLKLVAPAFLAASKKPPTEQKKFQVDESIPALFNGRTPALPAVLPVLAPEPVLAPAPELAPEPAPEATPSASEFVLESAPLTLEASQPAPMFDDTSDFVVAAAAPEPVEVSAPPLALALTESPAPLPEPEPAVATEPAPAPAPVDPHPVAQTVGEVFGQPDKHDWTPPEIVAQLVRLPGVSGAIVALQEGLPVAHSLAEGVKGDVIAAFLPQIFARLNQYAGEMRLGEVDDLLFTTHGAHCQIYRLGFVYFAVLGKPGESLPWPELRLITEELTRQTRKA